MDNNSKSNSSPSNINNVPQSPLDTNSSVIFSRMNSKEDKTENEVADNTIYKDSAKNEAPPNKSFENLQIEENNTTASVPDKPTFPNPSPTNIPEESINIANSETSSNYNIKEQDSQSEPVFDNFADQYPQVPQVKKSTVPKSYIVFTIFGLLLAIGVIVTAIISYQKRSSNKSIITVTPTITQAEAKITMSPPPINISITPNANPDILSRNDQRNTDITVLMYALEIYIKNSGSIPPEITLTSQPISTSGANLCRLFVPSIIGYLPIDPSLNSNKKITTCPNVYDTGYIIHKNSKGNVTIEAPQAENGEKISLTK
jgi:hypothetical protein